MNLTPGSMLADYRVTAELGAGGMGEVWRAEDTTLGREVAIKVLPEAFTADDERLARFDREAKLLASLNHPNIAGIYGFHPAPSQGPPGDSFLAMELVEGEDLAERLARASLPVDETLDVGRQIAAALEAAHAGGVVHRDLKPNNIFLCRRGERDEHEHRSEQRDRQRRGGTAIARRAPRPTEVVTVRGSCGHGGPAIRGPTGTAPGCWPCRVSGSR